MKVAVVNDLEYVIRPLVGALHVVGTHPIGILVLEGHEALLEGVHGWNPENSLEAIREAQVIFLDHHMPILGHILLASWENAGVDLANKRIVGMSGHGPRAQPYVKEHFTYRGIDHLRRFVYP